MVSKPPFSSRWEETEQTAVLEKPRNLWQSLQHNDKLTRFQHNHQSSVFLQEVVVELDCIGKVIHIVDHLQKAESQSDIQFLLFTFSMSNYIFQQIILYVVDPFGTTVKVDTTLKKN